MFSHIHSMFYASFVIMCSIITRSGSYLTNEWVVYSNVEQMFSWHNHYQCHHHSVWKLKRKKKEHTHIYKKQEAQYIKNSYWIISKHKVSNQSLPSFFFINGTTWHRLMAKRGMDFITLWVIKEHQGWRMNILNYECTSFFPPLKVFSLGSQCALSLQWVYFKGCLLRWNFTPKYSLGHFDDYFIPHPLNT